MLSVSSASGKDTHTKDATFRDAEDFKSSPYGIKVVKDYLLGFGEPPEELIAWVECMEWMKDVLEEWKKLSLSSKEGKM